jgi:hypothetical protein
VFDVERGVHMRRMRLAVIWLLAATVAALAGTGSDAWATSYSVMAWGGGELYNFGVLGNGTTHASDVPLAGSGLTGVSSIASGFGQTIAVMSDGTVTA